MIRLILRYSLAFLVVACIAVVAFLIVSFNHLDDAYAQWGAADMLIAYMEDHDGRWPKEWADLGPYFAAGHGRVSGWTYRDFQECVWIDFTADAGRLRAASAASDEVPFDVVGAKSIFSPCFEDGPNGMLHRYFRPDTPAPSSSSDDVIVWDSGEP